MGELLQINRVPIYGRKRLEGILKVRTDLKAESKVQQFQDCDPSCRSRMHEISVTVIRGSGKRQTRRGMEAVCCTIEDFGGVHYGSIPRMGTMFHRRYYRVCDGHCDKTAIGCVIFNSDSNGSGDCFLDTATGSSELRVVQELRGVFQLRCSEARPAHPTDQLMRETNTNYWSLGQVISAYWPPAGMPKSHSVLASRLILHAVQCSFLPLFLLSLG